MTQDFQQGDLVQLKSGGPVLTVTTIRSNTAIVCTYFNTVSGQFLIASFAPAALKHHGTAPSAVFNNVGKVPTSTF